MNITPKIYRDTYCSDCKYFIEDKSYGDDLGLCTRLTGHYVVSLYRLSCKKIELVDRIQKEYVEYDIRGYPIINTYKLK